MTNIAHSIFRRSSSQVSVRYDSLYFSMAGSQSNASKLIIHPKYNNRTIDNDIGIIRLRKKLELNRLNSSPVCLPSNRMRLSQGDLLTVSGWGFTDQGSVTERLMAAEVPLIALSKCGQQYKNLPEFYKITNNMICAGYDSGRIDACSVCNDNLKSNDRQILSIALIGRFWRTSGQEFQWHCRSIRNRFQRVWLRFAYESRSLY